MATHSCSAGYSLSNGIERTCQSDRSWNGENINCEGEHGSLFNVHTNPSMPICDIIAGIKCSTLSAIENTMVAYSNVTIKSQYIYGTTATYQCNSGYELTGGDTVRTCSGDGSSPVGQWSGTTPMCLGKKTVYIDNHGSGYLGMARCFNVHRRFPVSIERLITQLRKGND